MAEAEKPEAPPTGPVQSLMDLHEKAMAAHKETGAHLSAFDKHIDELKKLEDKTGSDYVQKDGIGYGDSRLMNGPPMDGGASDEKPKPKKKRAPIYDDRMKY